jgi:PHD/YefM family antitoxin component YafN of YafNO toxin-antitoxin module
MEMCIKKKHYCVSVEELRTIDEKINEMQNKKRRRSLDATKDETKDKQPEKVKNNNKGA